MLSRENVGPLGHLWRWRMGENSVAAWLLDDGFLLGSSMAICHRRPKKLISLAFWTTGRSEEWSPWESHIFRIGSVDSGA
jgi:hypothetical protein